MFAGQRVGVKEIEEKIWLVSFMKYDLGFFDHETGRIECAESQPLPMCPECILCPFGHIGYTPYRTHR